MLGWFTIYGKPEIKKNGKVIARANGRPFLISSKRYRDWEKDAIEQIKQQQEYWQHIPMPQAVRAAMVFHLPDRRPRDASNLYQGVEDAMEKAGVVENDRQIRSHGGSMFLLDRDSPRVVVSVYSLVYPGIVV